MQLSLFRRLPVTILVADFTDPNVLANNLIILNSLMVNKSLKVASKDLQTKKYETKSAGNRNYVLIETRFSPNIVF